MKFYQQDEIDELYASLRNKAYKDKSEWEKFLDKDRVRLKRQKKKKKDHETTLHDTYY